MSTIRLERPVAWFRERAFDDLMLELGHEVPPATRDGLAEALRDVAALGAEGAPIQQRDSYIRLAAWAVAAAADCEHRLWLARCQGATLRRDL